MGAAREGAQAGVPVPLEALRECLWLFAAQGDHRVDAGGAAGWDVTG
jgi:hypothetical protein